MPCEFVMCLLKLNQADLPFDISCQFLQGQSLVSRARNWLTGDFLATDYSHCLWIDCDIIFTPQDVERLASHDEAIVGGLCPFKNPGELSIAAEFLPDRPPPDPRGLIPMRYMGAGFLLVRRDVFERMLAVYGDESWFSYPVPDLGRLEHDFWRVGVYCGKDEYNPGRYLNEDLFFQQNALDLGFKIYGDTRVVLKHIGTIAYPATSQTMLWDGKLAKFVTKK